MNNPGFPKRIYIKRTTVFYFRITARSKTVCNTWENLNVIRGFDLLQYIFCTTARFLRESMVGFYIKVKSSLVFWCSITLKYITYQHKRAIKVLKEVNSQLSIRIIILRYRYWLVICLKWSSLREAGCTKAAMEDQVQQKKIEYTKWTSLTSNNIICSSQLKCEGSAETVS